MRTYTILRSSRSSGKTLETPVASGLSWDEADAERNGLDRAEREAHPEQTPWTRDLFILQLEATKGEAATSSRRSCMPTSISEPVNSNAHLYRLSFRSCISH